MKVDFGVKVNIEKLIIIQINIYIKSYKQSSTLMKYFDQLSTHVIMVTFYK